MKILLPPNKNVVPVVLPCVAPHLIKSHAVDAVTQVTEEELRAGEQTVREWYKPWLNLKQLKYSYFMSDGITKAIDLTRLEYADKSWTTLAGDYEWPSAFGKLNRKRRINELTDQVNYLTQPFAATGYTWTSEELASTRGTLVLDMAYISTIAPHVIPLPSNVDRIFVGASKTFGTAYLRHGWMFSRTPIPALELFMQQIRYFSNFNFRAGIELYKAVDPIEQVMQGFEYYDRIVADNPEYDLNGESWLIANTTVPCGQHLQRAGVYRIPLGLTIQQMLL